MLNHHHQGKANSDDRGVNKKWFFLWFNKKMSNDLQNQDQETECPFSQFSALPLTSHNPSFPIPSIFMASATLPAIAGAILSPLRQIALDKLITSLWDYVSTDQPSSSGEASKLQQLRNEWEALRVANKKLKTVQSKAKRLLEIDHQNESVIHFLETLNDVGYEIQDLESDMEYMKLQREVEKIKLDDAHTSQSRGPKRWFSFLWVKGQSSEKRRRLSSSGSLKLPQDDTMVNRIRELIKKINSMDSNESVLILLNEIYDHSRKNHQNKNKPETTSSTNERKIYGRKDETEKLIRLLLEGPNASGHISVVPILGMGGIGKTTLAQFAFNHPKIENYFDKKVWIFVSNHFDRLKITKEIVESLFTYSTPMFPHGTTNLDLLETELKRRLSGKKKFLLVLDDVWSDEWQQLLALLKLTRVESIKIILTSRDPTVSAGLDRGYGLFLKSLYGDEYKSFFIDCVFGNDDPDNYSLALQSIGEHIMEKLKGSPLAVMTVGRLLGRNLTVEHWKHVLDSDLWEIGSDANDIMPALALTFHHLPEHLQLCFAFCSVFPKGHEIHTHDLIGMWIAHDYILESGTNSKTLEDIGEEYFKELNRSFLIEVVPPKVNRECLCKMHDLLHDLAQSVSQGEVCIYEGKRGKRISRNVRHLCVCGPVDPESMQISNSLRTLVLYGDDMCNQIDLEALKRIRVLVVIDRNVQEFPEAVTHLKHLRYLDFSKSSFKCVPKSLCKLYQLRVLRLPQLDELPSLFHSLINLQSFMLFSIDHSNYQDNVYFWENVYQVRREGGCGIAQLRNMNELTGSLEIRGLENIKNKEDGRKANLKEKGLIKYLRLCWKDSVGAGCTHALQEEVFEVLQPHPSLKHLGIHGCMGSKSPSWLGTTPALQMLRRIELENCSNWSSLPPSIGLLPFLECLSLKGMENITIEGDDKETMIFPSLEKLCLIKLASVSFEGMSLPSSSSSASSSTTQPQPGGRKLFPLLEELRVYECDGVNGLPWPMLSQLSELYIRDSRGLDAQLPGCLKGLESLTWLEILKPKCETLFDREVMATLKRLLYVSVADCNELISVDGLQVLPSLRSLSIDGCRKLRRWWVEESTSEQQGVLLPNLSSINIRSCEGLDSLPACLFLLPSLETLSISHCWGLRWLWVEEGTSEPQGVLLPKLSYLSIRDCKDLESLPAVLPLLPSLEWLEISDCPKVSSLPEGGLPSSLRKLVIERCNPGLMERCQLELFLEWRMIRPSSFGQQEYIREAKHKERNEAADFSQ